MVHLLKGRPQIVHINMFFHNCICIKLFMPPEGATQKSYKALQIMSLFRLKTVVKTPMIPYLVCRPKVIFFFFFFSPSPTAESALMKKPGWECLRVPWRLCTSSINFLTVIQHLYKCDVMVGWYWMCPASPPLWKLKIFWLLEIRKNGKCPVLKRCSTPCHGTDVFRICKKCAAPISNCKNAFQLRGKRLWCISGVIKLSIRENCIE